MSTITTTLLSNPYVGATIQWKDEALNPFATNMRVQTTATIAEIATIAGFADVFSQARICDIKLIEAAYAVGGQDSATSLKYAHTTDYLEFTFESPTVCAALEKIQIPSPTPAAVASQGANPAPAATIFSDLSEREVNRNHPAILDFTAAVSALLASNVRTVPPTPVTDWVCSNIERVTTAVPARGRANS